MKRTRTLNAGETICIGAQEMVRRNQWRKVDRARVGQVYDGAMPIIRIPIVRGERVRVSMWLHAPQWDAVESLASADGSTKTAAMEKMIAHYARSEDKYER